MVRSGWATDFTCYSGGYYLFLEEEPKAAKKGLWQCDGDPPTKRWGGKGEGTKCEAIYKPLGSPTKNVE
jgi:endonuclease YncB( thermonuclease family)